MSGAHDVKVWKSLSREQRAWLTELLIGDAIAVEARESLACAWAFDFGRAESEAAHRSLVSRLFGV